MDLSNKSGDDILDYLAAEKERKWSREDAKVIGNYIKNEAISWQDRYNVAFFVCHKCTYHGNAMLFDSSNYPSLYLYLEDNRRNYTPYIGKGLK
jgi:hypothetical protein